MRATRLVLAMLAGACADTHSLREQSQADPGATGVPKEHVAPHQQAPTEIDPDSDADPDPDPDPDSDPDSDADPDPDSDPDSDPDPLTPIDTTILEPEPVEDDCQIIDVDGGPSGGCAVTQAGYVYCWGPGALGELGRVPTRNRCLHGSGDQAVELPCNLEPVRVPGVERAIAVSYGPASCALGKDGLVRCWGSNRSNVLGTAVMGECDNPYATDPSHPSRVPCSMDPVLVDDLEGARDLHAWGQTCATTVDGDVKCWGYHYPSATSVPGASPAVSSSASCALLENGEVRCWGSAESGRLGTDQPVQDCSGPYNQPCTLEALPVALDVASVEVSSGWQHACAITNVGELYCWGDNRYGELGLGRESELCGEYPCEPRPQRVPGLRNLAHVFAGIGSTCAITETGAVLCWGNLPIEGLSGSASVPREVPLPRPAITMSQERGGTCFVLDDGSLHCTGLRYVPRESDGIGVLEGAWQLERIDVCDP